MEEDRRVISVSRRTDIPAFYTPWFLNRLRAGFAEYLHPFTKQCLTVSLRPEDVSCLVFWSKNFAPLLPHLPDISRQYHFYCHFTITGLPTALEPRVPPTEEALRQAKSIASLFSPDHLQWRFDPIVLTRDVTPEATLDRFSTLARSMVGSTTRCYTSFVDPYPKVLQRLKEAGISLLDPPLEQQREIVGKMAQIASQHGISLYSCCEDALATQTPSPPQGSRLKAQGLGNPPLRPSALSPKPAVAFGHCIDPAILAAIGAPLPSDLRPAPTREQCGCFKSYDIGAYDTCPHLCLYCYANANPQAVHRNHAAHDPDHPNL
jgi:hypothetical protein